MSGFRSGDDFYRWLRKETLYWVSRSDADRIYRAYRSSETLDKLQDYGTLDLEKNVERLIKDLGGNSRRPALAGEDGPARTGNPIRTPVVVPPNAEVGSFLKQENARLRDDLADLRSQHSRVSGKNTDLETRLSDLTMTLERRQEQTQNLEYENSRLRKKVQDYSRDREELGASAHAATALEERLRAAEADRSRMEEEMLELRRRVQSGQKDISEQLRKERENSALRDEMKQLRFEMRKKERTNAALAEQIAERDRDIRDSKERGSRSESYKEELITQLREENEKSIGDLEAAKSQVKRMQSDRENILHKLESSEYRRRKAEEKNKNIDLDRKMDHANDQRREILRLNRELAYLKVLIPDNNVLETMKREIEKLQLTHDIYRTVKQRDTEGADSLNSRLRGLNRPSRSRRDSPRNEKEDEKEEAVVQDYVGDCLAEAKLMDDLEGAVESQNFRQVKEALERARKWGVRKNQLKYVEEMCKEMKAREDVTNAIKSRDPKELRRVINEAEYWNVDAKEGTEQLQKIQVEKKIQKAREDGNVDLLKAAISEARKLGMETREDEELYNKLKLKADIEFAIHQRNFPVLLMSVQKAQTYPTISLTRAVRWLDDIAAQRNWLCVCGNTLKVCVAKDCYSGKAVTCQITKQKLKKDSLVWHCFRGKCEKHFAGWNADLLTATGAHQSRVKGVVLDCETFKAIPEANIRYKLPNSSQYRNEKASKTGRFDYLMLPGDVMMRAEKEGYDATQTSIVLGENPMDVGLYMSQKCRAEQIRVVLTWVDIENALSLELYSRQFEVGPKKKRAKDGKCTVDLFQSKRKFGPQTITINGLRDSSASEVHILVRQSGKCRKSMSNTLGSLTVYRHDHEPLTMAISRNADIPMDSSGYYWHALTFKLEPLFQVLRVDEFFKSRPSFMSY